MEDKLVASALAPQHLASALGGDLPGAALDGTAAASWPSGGAGSGGFGGGFATGPASTEMQSMGSIGMPAPQFDADFEEIMRRLDEDERMESSLGGSTLQGPASSPKRVKVLVLLDRMLRLEVWCSQRCSQAWMQGQCLTCPTVPRMMRMSS